MGGHHSFRTGEHAGTSKQPSTFEVPPTKTLGPMLPIPRALTLASPSAHSTAFGSCLPASWGLTLTLGRPPSVPSQGAWSRNAGDWGHPNSSATLSLPPSHHMGASGPQRSFKTEKVQCTPSAWLHSKAPAPSPWAHTPPPQRPHSGATPLTPQLSAQACRPPGGYTLTLVQPLRGPSQWAWCRNAGDWLPPRPSARLTLQPSCHMGASWPRHSFRTTGRVGHSEHLSKEPCTKTFGPTLPLPGALTSAHPSDHSTAFGLGLPASWGLTLNLGRHREPFPRGLAPQRCGLGTPEPQHQTHPASRPPNGTNGSPPFIQDGRMCRAFHATDDFRTPPAPKRLGPRSPSPAPSPWPAPPLAAQPSSRSCQPPGA